MDHNEDHANLALLKLAAPFWGKPRWASLTVALTTEVQALEDAAIDSLTLRLLPNASRYVLGVLGKLVGEPDLGPLVYSDTVYRALIGIRLIVARSDATHYSIAPLLAQIGSLAKFEEAPPLGVLCSVDPSVSTAPLDTQAMLFRILREAIGVGITVSVLSPGVTGFRWSSGSASNAQWRSDASGAVGANWMGVLQG